MVFVFIGKKLISLDSILPLVAELQAHKKSLRVVIIAPDYVTYSEIKKNVTLYEYIQKNCIFIRLGGLSSRNIESLFQKIKWSFFLMTIWSILFLSKSKVIHFGSLNHKPRSILKFCNSSKIYSSDSNCWGDNALEDKIQRLSYGNKSSAVASTQKTLIAFAGCYTDTKSGVSDKAKTFCISPTKLWPAWNEFIDQSDKVQWEAECRRLGMSPDRRIIVVLLGTLDAMPFLDIGKDTLDELLVKTLATLTSNHPNISILLKPHVITQMDRLKDILERVNSVHVHVSYLHPQILANHAFVSVCNYYSTALIDFWFKGVKTVEYTRYGKPALAITSGGSIRPDFVDYFISIDDKKAFAEVCKMNSIDADKNTKEKKQLRSLTTADKKLIDTLLH